MRIVKTKRSVLLHNLEANIHKINLLKFSPSSCLFGLIVTNWYMYSSIFFNNCASIGKKYVCIFILHRLKTQVIRISNRA